MLSFEQLESRFVPATVVSASGLLTVYGDVAQSNKMLVETAPSGGVSLTVNGQTNVYADINHVVLIGGESNDVLINRSNVPASIYGLAGNDVIRVFSGNDFVVPGDGHDDVEALIGTNFVYVNEDADSDFVFASPTSFVSAASNDVVNQNPASFTYHLSGDTLYLFGGSAYSLFAAFNVDGGVAVLYGPQNFYVSAQNINYLVFVGGNENDAFVNYSSAKSIVFGGGGTDVYIGDLTKTQFADAAELVFAAQPV